MNLYTELNWKDPAENTPKSLTRALVIIKTSASKNWITMATWIGKMDDHIKITFHGGYVSATPSGR